eukprot:1515037-Rhodomonas_salina.4
MGRGFYQVDTTQPSLAVYTSRAQNLCLLVVCCRTLSIPVAPSPSPHDPQLCLSTLELQFRLCNSDQVGQPRPTLRSSHSAALAGIGTIGLAKVRQRVRRRELDCQCASVSTSCAAVPSKAFGTAHLPTLRASNAPSFVSSERKASMLSFED